MTFISETSSRSDLEVAALEADLDLDAIEAASDAELLAMIQDWIAAGDECEAA